MMFTLKSLRRLVVGTAVALATTGLVLTVPLSAAGREGGGGHGHFDGHVDGHFDGRGFGSPNGFAGAPGHFRAVDPGHWRDGHWNHGFHDGRLGWWWVVDDGWYYYPNATYPYPQYWYYCPSAGEYYPYASACPEGWTPVIPQ